MKTAKYVWFPEISQKKNKTCINNVKTQMHQYKWMPATTSRVFCFCPCGATLCMCLLKSDIQGNGENTKWRVRFLTVHFTGIVNAFVVFHPLIGGAARHLQQGWSSLMKSAPYDFLTNKSICQDRMISHHSGVFGRSHSWRRLFLSCLSQK